MAGMEQSPQELGRAAGFPVTTPGTLPALPRPIVPQNAQELVTNGLMRPIANTVQAGVQQAANGMPDWLRQLAASLLPQTSTQLAGNPGIPPAPAQPALSPAARPAAAQAGFIPVANNQ